MMTGKHTKGTWHAVGYMIELADDEAPDIATFNHAVFGQGQLHRLDAEILANVKLAAAAPDLLAASVPALHKLDVVIRLVTSDKTRAEMQAVADNLRAAIAKATSQ